MLLKAGVKCCQIHWSCTYLDYWEVMFRTSSLRLIQRLIILATILSLFGSLFVWLCLYTDSEKRRDTNENIKVLSDSEGERLDDGISSRALKRNGFKDVQASSIVAKNVFGIRPVVITGRSLNIHLNEDTKKDKGIIHIGVDSSSISKISKRYMFVFHHHEQFSKTTENFVQLCAIAAYGSRTVIEPFVRDSRMCGLETG